MMRAMLLPSDLRRLVLCLLVAAASPAHADGTSVVLEALTWTELKDQVRGGRTTVIVPIGGTEQNGPHMALGKHNRRVALLAEKIALDLGNAVVAPVVAYVPEGAIDPPSAHMRYTGTISLPPETFVRVLEAAAQSFRRHGFTDIVFIGDHGGYQQDMRRAAERLNRAWSALPARAHAIAEYYETASTGYPDLLRKRGFAQSEIGTHAGLADTSLMLALDPAYVRVERLHAAPAPGGVDGTLGDPRRSSAEAGRLGAELIVARSVAAIRRATSRP
jgi:creatinine amidohydrolase/Fe(II)-dependent formamide hydrolase-like protein